ncbi:RNA-guided endonuclease TnpB family protein, partial [Neisseria sp. N177_16]
MLILKTFKFELMPNGEQIRKMKQFCGCSRFVFNRALAYQNEQYQQDNSFKFSYTKIANLLPEWKRELDWLKDCHSQVLQQSLKDLESAFKNFFAKRADFPKFKRKGEKDSFRFPQGCKLEQQNNRIYLPKIGWVRYRNSRHVSGSLKNVTVSQKCGKWFVSMQTETEQEIAQP